MITVCLDTFSGIWGWTLSMIAVLSDGLWGEEREDGGVENAGTCAKMVTMGESE